MMEGVVIATYVIVATFGFFFACVTTCSLVAEWRSTKRRNHTGRLQARNALISLTLPLIALLWPLGVVVLALYGVYRGFHGFRQLTCDADLHDWRAEVLSRRGIPTYLNYQEVER